MKLGTDECTRALNKYMKEVAKDEIDKVCVEILLSNDPLANIDIIDSFLVNYIDNDRNTIVLTIVNRIRDIRTSLGIEESKLEVEDIDDYDENIDYNIDLYITTLVNSIYELKSYYIDKCQDKTLNDFCDRVTNLVSTTNEILLDVFKQKSDTNKKKPNLNERLKNHNLTIIK